jgi:hypothetical protein
MLMEEEIDGFFEVPGFFFANISELTEIGEI